MDMKPTQEQVIAWAREAGVFTGGHPMNPWSVYPSDLKKLAALAYEAGRKDENDVCAKVCYYKAWEIKERAMKEKVKTQRARLTSEAVGWHDAFSAIRARREQ